MAYPNYSDTNLNPLILNYVPDKITFDLMESDNRIEEDLLYLIPEDDEIAGAFFAEYDVTTWDEIVSAIEAGKNVICIWPYNDMSWHLSLSTYDDNGISFSLVYDSRVYECYVFPDNSWDYWNYSIGSPVNLSDTISSSLNASQSTAATPNAVYSALVNVGTTGDVTGRMNTSSWNITTAIVANAITSAKIQNGAVTVDKIATNAVTSAKISNGAVTNVKLANSSMNIAGSSVALGGSLAASTLLTNLGLSSAMHFIGKATVAITDNSTTNPNISGYDFASDRKAGDVIIGKDDDYEYVWTLNGVWERLGSDGSYKVVLSAQTSPSANGSASAFIDTISLDTQGVITATKKNVVLANNFTVKFNGGTTEGTSLYSFNGSAAKSVNIKSGTGIEIAAAANEITIANVGVLGIKGAAESSYRTGNASINGANILGSNAIGNSSTPVYWNGAAFTNTIGSTIEYIVGTLTASTGSWTGVTKDAALYTGKTIAYKLPYTGSGNATLNLTLSGGGTTGAKDIYVSGSTRLTTHYGANSIIILTYDGTCWRRADYWNSNSRDAGYGKITPGLSTSIAAITTTTAQVSAGTYNENLNINAGNKWIQLAAANGSSNGNDSLTIGHSAGLNAKTTYGSTATTASANGGTIVVTDVQYDEAGHITSSTDRTIILSLVDNDTKNTAGSSNNASKMFLVGALSQVDNTITYSHSAVYATNGALTATSFSGNGATLTAINASNISSGTLPDARLSTITRTNNTSANSPAHGGNFTTIDSITTDSYGRVTAINTKTVTLPADNNTDTKVTQNNTTSSVNYRVLLSNSASDSSETNLVYKSANFQYNPSTNKLSTGNVDLTGDLDVIGNADFHNQTTAESLTAGSLLVNGQSNFVLIPTAPTAPNGTSDTKLATTEFVTSAISTLAGPMRFIGTLGTGGTATSLAAASADNKGYAYKVITAGTYQSVAAKVGDMLVSTGSSWVLIPSGDEPSGTVTSITLIAGGGIALDTNNSAITTSGSRTISHADTSSVSNVSAADRTYVKSLTFDTYGHVTGVTTGTETVTDTKNTAGSTDTSSKIFLIGATSLADNPLTYSDNEVYATNGVLTVKTLNSTSLTASLAVSTDANKNLVSSNLYTADPTTSGTDITYIASVSLSAIGKITATKSTVRSASTSLTGIVQLNDSVSNTSTSVAATANAVKTAYDLANSKQNALTTSAVGSTTLPIYWNGSTFVNANINASIINAGILPISRGGTGQNSAANIFTALSWTAGNTSGPNLSVTILGLTRNAAIPAASNTASGVVTTGVLSFQGNKTFYSDEFRIRNSGGNNTQVNNKPYVTELTLGDGRYTRLTEYADDKLAIRGTTLVLTNLIDAVYNNAATYSVGSVVWYSNNYYRCKTNISTAEEFNASNWSAYATQGVFAATDFMPAINLLYSLGNVSYQWKTVYANSINASYLSGNGAALSAINASNISTGTLPNNRLATVTRTNNTSSATASHGSTFKTIDSITTDTYGRVTAINTNTITLPSDNDTKNTAGSTNNASKMFLVGALSLGANPQTYSHSAVYATNGALTATSFSGNGASLTGVIAAKLNSTQATAANKYYILGQEAAGNSTTYIATAYGSGSENTAGVYFQGSTGVLMGAAWNDYAEFRAGEDVEPGRVVREKGDDTLELANDRLLRGCSIVSDTFGFGIGENNNNKLPVAVSGRVLAYPYESRDEFRKYIGYAVCSGPNGTVSIMTEQEERDYPSAIIGTISAVPDYEVWHGGIDVEIKDRIWIKVR